MKRWVTGVLVALALAVAGPIFAADDSYSIKLIRPTKVGAVRQVDAVTESTQTVTTTREGVPQVQTTTVKGALQGRVEILEVDKKGLAQSMVITVKKCVDGDGNELLKPGEELRVTRGESISFSLAGGGTISDAGEKVLHQIFGSTGGDRPTEDECYGSSDAHKVGDSWAVNGEATAKLGSRPDMMIDGKALKGTTTLKAAEIRDGVPVLRLSTEFEAPKVVLVPRNSAMRFESATVHGESDRVVPVDTSAGILEQTSTVTMEQHYSSPTDGTKVDVKGVSTTTVKTAAVKK